MVKQEKTLYRGLRGYIVIILFVAAAIPLGVIG
ncbi:unnamed protein product, partial [marine sediment metagenome]